MKAVFACLGLSLLFVASSARGQEASREDYQKLCSDMVGRWVGDVTWITDWPGLGTKGEKVTGYWEGRMAEDGNLMIGKFYGGNGSETMLSYYDAAARRIRWTTVSSGGTVFQAVVYRDGDQWVQVSQMALPDGKTGEVRSVGTITDGGATWTWEMNGTIGDDEVKDHKDVWRRVSSK